MQLLIYSAPPVLTIHLKRFEASSFELRKVNRHVQFGERLDLAPFCSSVSQDLPQMHPGQRRSLYSLFGVVEHSGRLTSGHYTAYVRVRRRQDRLAVNPAMLSPLVTDAINIACERARQLAQQTAQSPAQTAAQTAETSQTSQYHGTEMDEQRQQQSQPEPQLEREPEPETDQWFHVSDMHVTEVTLDKVLKAQAYMLFYERTV